MAGFNIKLPGSFKDPQVRTAIRLTYIRQKEIWNEAIGAFILVVGNEVSKHQDTGMSLASLFPTARKIGMLDQMPSLNPKVTQRKPLTYISRVREPSSFKNALVGVKLGEKASRISYGSEMRPLFLFSFEIRVYQYLLNEFGWGSIRAMDTIGKGRTAFFEHLHTTAPDFFPRLRDMFSSKGKTSFNGRRTRGKV